MIQQPETASPFSEVLARARTRARYTQDEVGAALGVNRAMVSYWESGTRTPNDRQVGALARLYGAEIADLLTGSLAEPVADDLAGLLLREGHGLGPDGVIGVREFVDFLDRFAELCGILHEQIGHRTQSPFVYRQGYTRKDDARRKAEEVRAHLGFGTGPIGDIDAVCEALGVTVYRAALGSTLDSAPSGAFLRHPEAGLSILVNLDMTPGGQCFATVHELAHALFHSPETNQVLCREAGRRENFANAFAGEFLMPSAGVRRFAEQLRMPPRISDPVDIIRIQRHFDVSWPTALVRLRQMNAITQDSYTELKATVRPEYLARALGYPVRPELEVSDPATLPMRRFPRSFLRMLHRAISEEIMSPPTAASFAGLAVPDVVQILGSPLGAPVQNSLHLEAEFDEFEVTGVA